MHPLIQTIYKASDTFMFEYVTTDEDKITSFKIDDPKKNMGYFALPTYPARMK